MAAERIELPEPLAAVVEYLGDDLDEGRREFVPTAELVEALEVEPTAFGRQMGDCGCRSERFRVPGDDGRTKQVRGYATAEIRAAVDAVAAGTLDPGDREDDP